MTLTQATAILITCMIMSPPALAENKKLTAKELEALIKVRYIASGITDDGWAFIVINHAGGVRDVYINDFYGSSRTRKEKAIVKGDQLCEVRDETNAERCFEIYHLGGNRYEAWLYGKRYTTWYFVVPFGKD